MFKHHQCDYHSEIVMCWAWPQAMSQARPGQSDALAWDYKSQGQAARPRAFKDPFKLSSVSYLGMQVLYWLATLSHNPHLMFLTYITLTPSP
jgi:hypothetical protein